MKRIRTTIAAILLVLGAGLGGWAVGIAAGPSSHTASTSSSSASTKTVSTAPIMTTSITAEDAVTEHAYAIASPSVVYINNVGIGTGSGVIYDSTGDIVTNAHVVDGASTLRVTLNNGKTLPARIVGTDTADDLAVIHVNATGLPAAHFAKAGTYHVAQTVLAIGNPLGLGQTVTSGLISALNRTVQEPNGAYLPNAIQTSAPINPGNSGGALVTLNGTVVGIPTLEATDTQDGSTAQGIGFAVPSSRVIYVANQIIAHGKVVHTGRAYLGIAATDALTQSGFPFGPGGFFGQGRGQITTVAGALVQAVAPEGPAAKAGVQTGDVITAVNGNPISSEDDLLTALAHAKPGQTMTLTLNRNGTTLTAHVHLGELPASG
jgi:putative serine protease PepD